MKLKCCYLTIFYQQDKVFPNYRENDMKDKSETDFSMRRNKDKKQKGNIKKL